MPALLNFNVENFRSIKGNISFSMIPSRITDEPKGCVIKDDKYKYLSSAVIYGANSSGKSNVVLALAAMRHMVLNSVKLNDDDKLNYDPFLLSTETMDKPTHFEIEFVDNDYNKVRYGFEYNSQMVLKEWLFIQEKRKENICFIRDAEGIAVNSSYFPEGDGNEERTNDNRLYISLLAQLGGNVSKKIISFFRFYNVISGLTDKGYTGITEKMFHNQEELSASLMEFYKKIGLGFDGIETAERNIELPEDMPDSLKKKYSDKKVIDVYSTHGRLNEKGDIIDHIRFPFFTKESQGTQKLFELSGPIFDSLSMGRVLIIDELDAKMHPLISQYIISLFNDKSKNPNKAQLIFTTHDTNLLASGLLRRDQIWFTEKDQFDSTDLYNMMNIVLPDGTKPRGDGNLERNYIKGRYGAIPFIKSF